MDITTGHNTTTKGEEAEGEGRYFTGRTFFKKSQSYKMLLIRKSIVLLVSFLCYVIEMMYIIQKKIIYYTLFLRRAPKPQVTYRKGNSPSNANTTTGQTQIPTTTEGSYHFGTYEIHNKAQFNTKDIYSQGHSPSHQYRSLNVRS